MRYLCPDECASVTLGGVVLVKAKDGTIEAAAEAAVALAPHGLVAVDATADARNRIEDRRLLR